VIAVAAVAVGAVVVWVWNPPRPRDPGPPDEPPITQKPSDDLLWEEARAKKLPEYAELRTPIDPRAPLTEEHITRVLELTGHPNVIIRISAVNRLTRVTGPRRGDAVECAARKLHDPHLFVRLVAMAALGELGAREKIPELLPFLSSPDHDERRTAKRVLERLGHPVGD
jgi:HEAT repeat protein